jgi:hypothetical protein
MTNGIRARAARVLGALAVAAALGFGGAQAFASPGAAVEGAARCTDGTCNSRCVSLGYTGGRCVGATCTCFTAST